MASTANLRTRRSVAQLQALAGVEREIRSQDSSSRRKYLQDFTHAFRNYEAVLEFAEWKLLVAQSDVVLIGDYHALPASQRFAARLLEELAHGDRPVVLALETIFARDQHILDEWWRREIDEDELRHRIRFDLDWGYDWEPFSELLFTAREHAEGLYGLDCMPREDLRKIGARDKHAAHKLAEIRRRHPKAVILVLFGESHLAPDHLPRELQQHFSSERVLTVLQNVDALYWQAAGEPRDVVEAVRVNESVTCVFNSTPLEKYEHYRLHLSRWGCGGDGGPDLAPTVYNLIDSLLGFLGINRYSSHNGTQPKFLVDLMPEVYGPSCGARLRRLMLRQGMTDLQIYELLSRIEERGSIYIPQVNAFFVREFQMMYAAEEAARFLHHACRGLPWRGKAWIDGDGSDRFYSRTLEHVLGYFGSRMLYPARPGNSSEDEIEVRRVPRFTDEKKCETSAQLLGYMLGDALYHAYIMGDIPTSQIRRLFLKHLDQPGSAKQVYAELAAKVSPRQRRCRK
ncbi:MAG TPA: ChaN family lipoprotein [Terriglobales bacterium]|nr:ChaN family lipoprotein [Terriglobales bacterium]